MSIASNTRTSRVAPLIALPRGLKSRRLKLAVIFWFVAVVINRGNRSEIVSSVQHQHDRQDQPQPSASVSQAQKLIDHGSTSIFAVPPSQWSNTSIYPVGNMLRIYVYESLIPKELGKDVEDFLYQQHLRPQSFKSTELPWIRLFRSYPGRTWDPFNADLFVVDYAHSGHCSYYYGWELKCRHVPNQLTQELLLSSLPHFSGNESRHLFLLSNDRHMLHPHLLKMPLTLSFGPRLVDTPSPGFLISGQFNDLPHYQPSVLVPKFTKDEWWTRHRRFSFVCLSGEENERMRKGGRKFRRYFHQDMDAQVNDMNQLGGLPYHFEPIVEGAFNATTSYDLYSNAVFCPVLAGDAPWQRRFFDVIMSGCVPVVLSWTRDGKKSWFTPEKPVPIADAYPFAKGQFGGDETIEIDYESIVVECPGNRQNESDVSCLRRTMEDMLLHRPDEIRMKQLQLKRYALAFALGLGEDAHKYEDGFARTIRALKYYFDHHVRR